MALKLSDLPVRTIRLLGPDKRDLPGPVPASGPALTPEERASLSPRERYLLRRRRQYQRHMEERRAYAREHYRRKKEGRT